MDQVRRYIILSNGRIIDPAPETLLAQDTWGKRDVEKMIEIHAGIVLSLTPANWELPATLTLETLAAFGEFMADQIEASRQIGAMNEPDESAAGIDEKAALQRQIANIGRQVDLSTSWLD